MKLYTLKAQPQRPHHDITAAAKEAGSCAAVEFNDRTRMTRRMGTVQTAAE